ncbi:sigma-70 family RNA polymerase sigma factor [Actinoplanes sp. NPDC049118]|uniref:RNA polymerase sigma factor n=1 Tax=Actinoplanes sp. NPDC049118 TaxID=3155769 RepID=UPI0033EAC19C
MTAPAPSEFDSGDVEEWAVAAAAGSQPALRRLLAAISADRMAHPALRRVLVDPADVEDAAQETLIAVSRGIGTFAGRARFTTWLYQVARNTALEVLRRKDRGGIPTDELPDPGLRAGELRRMSSMAATRLDVENAMRLLPGRYREALRLREWEQRSYEEIATELDLPLNTVRTHINRGRRLLAIYLTTAPPRGDDRS